MSSHRYGVLAICVQWVDAQYQLQKALLGLPECQYSHSGDTQAGLIAEVLRSFNITKLGYHTSDNATSNDACLESLSEILQAKHNVRTYLHTYLSTYLSIYLAMDMAIDIAIAMAIAIATAMATYLPTYLPTYLSI